MIEQASIEMKIVRNAAIIFSSKLLLFLLNFAKSILIHRLLGPLGKGKFALITQIPRLLTTVGSLSIGTSTLYYTARKKHELNDIISTSFIVAVFLGLILIFLVFLLFDYLPISLIRDLKLNQILIASLIIPFSLINIYSVSILLGRNYTQKAARLWVLAPFSLLFYLVLFNVIWKYGVMGAVAALVMSTVTVTVISVVYLLQQAKIRFRINRGYLKQTVSYGLKAHLGACAQFLNYRLDIFFVQYYLGFTQLGYYTLAVALAELLWDLPFSVSTALFQKVSSSIDEDANKLTPLLCRNTFFLMLLITGGVFLMCKVIIRIAYSPAFLPSALALRILLPGILILSITKVLSGDLSGRGKPIYSTKAALIGLFLNISLNLLFIPKWGIVGAAFASTISYSTQTAVILFYFVRESKNRIVDVLIIKRRDFALYQSFFSEQMKKIAIPSH